jgi:hypothetical protein
MGFRVPYHLLSEEHKVQIRKDLCLKEKKGQQWWAKNGPNKYSRSIIFYSVDQNTNDIILPMYYASTLFNRPHINQRKVFHRIAPFNFKTQLRDYQEEVVDLSLKSFMTRGSTFLNVFCSFGKTVVAAYFAALFARQYNVATLVTYPLTMIESSWIGTFRDLTDAKIYIVGETPGPPDPDVQVFLCMDTRLPGLDRSIRDRIGHFVIDEADSFCTPGRVESLLSVEPLFVTVLTATYERDDGFEVMLDLLAGPERITRISRKPFFVFQRATKFTVEPRVGPRGIIYDDLVEQLDNIPERNAMIVQTVLDNLNEKPLVLTKHVEHAKNLHAWLTHYLQPYGKTCALLAGNIQKYDDASVIVGTISKVGRGFDENKACHDWRGIRINMLILASSTKKIEQIAGRVFRADVPLIVDFVDDHKNLKAHWRARKNWYESRNGVVYSINDRFNWNALKPQLLTQYLAIASSNLQQTGPVVTSNAIINVTAAPQRDPEQDLSRNHAARAAMMWTARMQQSGK